MEGKRWEHFKERAFSDAEKSNHTMTAGSVEVVVVKTQ